MNWQRISNPLYTNSAFTCLFFDNHLPCFFPAFTSISLLSSGPIWRILSRLIVGTPIIPAILRAKTIKAFMPFRHMWRPLICSGAIFANQLGIWHESYSSILVWFKRSAISFWGGSPSIHLNYHFGAETFATTKTFPIGARCENVKHLAACLARLMDSVFGAHVFAYDRLRAKFSGSGTVGQVALELGRRAILIELKPTYLELARDRTYVTPGMF